MKRAGYSSQNPVMSLRLPFLLAMKVYRNLLANTRVFSARHLLATSGSFGKTQS